MVLYGITPKQVRTFGIKEGDRYKFCLGTEIEVTTTKKANANQILTGSLSSHKHEDALMMKYNPSNVIYFDADLVEVWQNFLSVSCEIDKKTYAVRIGISGRYPINGGILALSGVMSANGLVERQRAIFCNAQMAGRIYEKVRILSVGALRQNLLGVFLVQRERGIAVGVDDSEYTAISAKTLNYRQCMDWSSFYIDDWFDNCRVTVVAPNQKVPSKKDLDSLLAGLVTKDSGVSKNDMFAEEELRIAVSV